jgi:hypothetical protein
MAKIKIDIKLGRSKTGSYNSSDNRVANELRDRLTKAVMTESTIAAEKKIEAMQQDIVTNLESDLTKFAQMASAFFFSRRALEGTSRMVTIQAPPSFGLKDFESKSGNFIYRWRTRQTGNLLWPGLATSTMRKKRRKGGAGATTFFIYNDVLRQEMASAFGDLIGKLFEPTVTFSRATERDAKTGRFVKGNSVGKITIRVFRNPADSSFFSDALSSGNWADAPNDTRLLTKYLSVQVAEKLNNYHKGGVNTKRPWVGPSVAYWLINRMPTVIANSVKKSLTR